MFDELKPETQAAFRELFAAIEKQHGPIVSFSMCESFEDSPMFKATIACECQPHDDAFECAAHSLGMSYDEAVAHETYCQCACHDRSMYLPEDIQS